MIGFRPLTGIYRNFLNGLPLVGAQIKIKLSKNDYDLEAGYPVMEIPITLTETGSIPDGTLIWKTARGFDGAKAVFIEPDGFKWEAVVPDDPAPISIQELRANGTILTPPETVLALIAATDLGELHDVDFDELEDGDVPTWDAVEQKFVNRQGDGGGIGGSGSNGYLPKFQSGNLADSRISDDGTTINFAGKTKTTVQSPSDVGYLIQLASGQTAKAVQIVGSDGASEKFAIEANGNVLAYGLTVPNIYSGGYVFRISPGGSPAVSTARQLAFVQDSLGYFVGGIAYVGSSTLKITDGGSNFGNLQVGTLYLNDGTIKEVTFGANDSGGAGYKTLRIPN